MEESGEGGRGSGIPMRVKRMYSRDADPSILSAPTSARRSEMNLRSSAPSGPKMRPSSSVPLHERNGQEVNEME